jgi:putative DNA primase/helicase
VTTPPDDPNAPGGPDDGSAVAEVIPIQRKRGKRAHTVPLPVHPTDSWQSLLRCKTEGGLTKDPGNAALLLTNDPVFKGALQYDEFADRARWTRTPVELPGLAGPAPGDAISDRDVVYAQHWLAITHATSFSDGAIHAALTKAAHANTVHPPRDYFSSLVWDNNPRIHSWLQTYLGAPTGAEHEYIYHVGRLWLISAVARVMQPGCQADYLVVLEGEQGVGKSSAARILGGDWYLGNIPNMDDKDSSHVLRGKLIVEIAELAAMRRAEIKRVNEYLTRTVDTYRPPYGHHPIDQPRQCVFIGTTNDHQYLQDETGGRRFWGVPVGTLKREELQRDRDQLWAEAVHQWRSGEQWHPNALNQPLIKASQADRYQHDEWEPRIAEWINKQLCPFTVGEVLQGCLSIEPAKWERSQQTRVGIVLSQLGLVQSRKRPEYIRKWWRPEG